MKLPPPLWKYEEWLVSLSPKQRPRTDIDLGNVGEPIVTKVAWWDYFGSLFLAPYLWFKGKELEEKTERAINIAGYIGVFVIVLLLVIIFIKVK